MHTRLPFEVDERIDPSLITAHAGIPLAMELFRASGAAALMDKVASPKQRKRGLSASESAESLFALWLAGGERCEDMSRLKEDRALTQMLGFALPSQKFGANAAWLRLNVLCHNLISTLKRVALPGEFRTIRLKRLRFLLFNTVG